MGSWFVRGTVLVRVQARLNDHSAERIRLGLCQRFPVEEMKVCTLVTYTNIHLFYNHLSSDLFVLCDAIFYFAVGWTEALPDTPVDETPPGPEVPEKIKKRYRKKKTKLEEAFPTYLQVCHLLLFDMKSKLCIKKISI